MSYYADETHGHTPEPKRRTMTPEEVVALLEEMVREGWRVGYSESWIKGEPRQPGRFSLFYTNTAYTPEAYATGSSIVEVMAKVEPDWRERMHQINYGRKL